VTQPGVRVVFARADRRVGTAGFLQIPGLLVQSTEVIPGVVRTLARLQQTPEVFPCQPVLSRFQAQQSGRQEELDILWRESQQAVELRPHPVEVSEIDQGPGIRQAHVAPLGMRLHSRRERFQRRRRIVEFRSGPGQDQPQRHGVRKTLQPVASDCVGLFETLETHGQFRVRLPARTLAGIGQDQPLQSLQRGVTVLRLRQQRGGEPEPLFGPELLQHFPELFRGRRGIPFGDLKNRNGLHRVQTARRQFKPALRCRQRPGSLARKQRRTRGALGHRRIPAQAGRIQVVCAGLIVVVRLQRHFGSEQTEQEFSLDVGRRPGRLRDYERGIAEHVPGDLDRSLRTASHGQHRNSGGNDARHEG
jgi:hypothetical protein